MAFPNSQSNPAAAIPVWIAANAGAGTAFSNIAAATSTLVKTGAGQLQGITVNTTGTASTATVYDGTSAAGTKIATINTTVAFNGAYSLAFTTGLFIVTVGAADITVTYK